MALFIYNSALSISAWALFQGETDLAHAKPTYSEAGFAVEVTLNVALALFAVLLLLLLPPLPPPPPLGVLLFSPLAFFPTDL